VYSCNFIRLKYLQFMRNMALLLLFTHTITSTIVGISLTGCIQPTRISHTNLKISMVISVITTSKNHIEILVTGQI
jgi:hypothetical protein